MEAYVIIIIIFGVIAFFVFGMLYFVNRLTLLKNAVEKSFYPMRFYIEERINILRDMIEFLSGDKFHEEEFVKKLEKARDLLDKANGASDGMVAVKNTEDVFARFSKLNSVYSFLGKNKTFLDLKRRYLEHWDKVKYSSYGYDREVRLYNNYKKNVIISMLNKYLHFPDYIYYNDSL